MRLVYTSWFHCFNLSFIKKDNDTAVDTLSTSPDGLENLGHKEKLEILKTTVQYKG